MTLMSRTEARVRNSESNLTTRLKPTAKGQESAIEAHRPIQKLVDGETKHLASV
jgi:hypothetical protein